MKTIDIGELGRRAGLPASTLRHYEACGLISSVGRRGLRRVFEESVVERLALIALGRVAGFSLEEIARMFAPDGTPRIDRSLLLAKARELTATIQKLEAMRQGLRHAAACKAPTHMECPTFRRLLKAAASGRWGRAPAPKPVPRPRTPQTLARKRAASRRNPKSAQGFSQCRGRTECRVPHRAGFDVPLTRAAGVRRTRHELGARGTSAPRATSPARTRRPAAAGRRPR